MWNRIMDSTMDTNYHMMCLDNLCRICTCRAQTKQDIKSNKPPIIALAYKQMILTLFGINIENDIATCHPQKICKECYRLLINSKNRGENGNMNVSGSYGQQKDRVSKYKGIWTDHTNNCNVCIIFTQQCKGGSQKKKPRGGSIKLQYDKCSVDIFSCILSRPVYGHVCLQYIHFWIYLYSLDLSNLVWWTPETT